MIGGPRKRPKRKSVQSIVNKHTKGRSGGQSTVKRTRPRKSPFTRK